MKSSITATRKRFVKQISAMLIFEGPKSRPSTFTSSTSAARSTTKINATTSLAAARFWIEQFRPYWINLSVLIRKSLSTVWGSKCLQDLRIDILTQVTDRTVRERRLCSANVPR